jgi:hypothetical protein
MAKENEIAAFLNEEIKKSLSDARFNGSQFSGITQLVAKADSTVKPCIVDHEGEGTDLTVDDVYPVQVYHRNYGGTFKPNPATGFGDGNTAKNQVTNMGCIVIGQRKKIKLTPEDLLVLVAASFPAELPKAKRAELKLTKSAITITNIDINSLAVFKREYQFKDNVLDPSIIMLELKYQIECGFEKDCINTICCTV